MIKNKMGFYILSGYLAVLGYCIITAYYTLAIHSITQETDPYLLTLLMFLICLILFSAINLFSIKKILTKARRDLKNLFFINILTAINWIAVMWSLKYINPTPFIAIFMAFLPIFTFIISLFIKKSFNKKEFLFVLILLFSIIFFIHLNPIYKTNHFAVKGALLCLLSTLVGAFYLIISEKFQHNTELSTSQLLAVRFYLLVVITAYLTLHWGDGATTISEQLRQINYLQIITLSVLTTALPLYLLQQGIYSIGSAKVSYIIPATIIFTYILELAYKIVAPNFLQIVTLCVLTLVIVYLKKIKRH